MWTRRLDLSFLIKFFPIFLYSISIHLQLFSQIHNKGVPFIKNYSQNEYHAGPQNWSIVQDSRGVMFFGNNYGLIEFDGNTWRLLGISNKTIVRSLAVDKNGRIYVGGQGDFGYLSPNSQGELYYVSLKSKIALQEQNFDDVWKIYVTEDGVAFCANAAIFYLKDDEIKVHKPEQGIFNFSFFVNQRLLVTVKGKGIYELKNDKLFLIPNSERFSNVSIASILSMGDMEALIITEESGLFTYDGYTTFKPWEIKVKEFFTDNKITTACLITDGFALGSTHKGLLLLNRSGKLIQHLNREKGLQTSTILSLYQDSGGNLWLGLNNGIDYVEINSPFTVFGAEIGIPGSGYTSLIYDNKLFLGTNDGLYYKSWFKEDNLLSSPKFQPVENTLGQVYHLQNIGNQLLLSHHFGPYLVKEDQAIMLTENFGVWKFLPLKNHLGYVLAGSYSGLLLFKEEAGALTFIKKVDGFSESSRVMEEDDDGSIWIAHGYKGLYKITLSPNLERVTKVKFYGQKDGFPSNLFINVFKINNRLVFTGEKGYYKYDKENDRFSEFEEYNKLFPKDEHIRKLVQDKEGNIWFSWGDELGVFKKKSNGVFDIEKNVFNKIKGKLVGGFEHIAYYDPYNVIIGTAEGFVHYNPSFPHHKTTENNFHTLIRRVEITGGQKDSLVTAGVFLKKDQLTASQPEENVPSIPFKNNSIRFTYSALAFEDIEKVQYQFLLEGFDAKWSGWTNLRHKEYTNLKEGNYTFHVKARDIYNRESIEATYKFSISPPWYRSIYAFICYFLVFLILLYVVKKIMEKRINKARQRLQQEQEKAFKLKESQHMEEVLKAEKEIIKLNNEKLENELIHKNKELTSSAMHVMHSRETIIKIKEQLEFALENVKDKDANFYLRKVIKSIEADVKFDNKWEQFELHFNQIHQDFLKRLREDFPELTHKDIKLCAYLRMNLSSKEIAPLLNISLRGIEASRYRIRRKMNLDADVNLTEFILKY